ncbi:MAG TPA: low molecular weight protein-tyrosine-phosphatase [Psychrobacter sp.]|uniref:low molecular weight protein-tyrosine-phosphatase n=1 Tax=Psychrobacter sp. TaxID=56811 RepID=UPI002CA5F890|nr:low molecular weight protein-tyrosine-phosphatase [Psychrobacter sp.]HSP85166.1 low molecular weight protein-tyrosine-phosphatase [Psychrobacter sp.]
MAFDNILVVCVGNICRSPIAAAVLMDQFSQKHIDSAGLSAVVDNPADPKALEVMTASNAAINASMNKHVAKQITEALTVKADLILTMSTSQSKWIEDQWPHCRGKTFRIGHWIDKDVADPYGHSESAFETAKQDIFDSLDMWLNKIS